MNSNFALILIITLTSCNSDTASSSKQVTHPILETKDTVIREIPLYRDGTPVGYYLHKRLIAEKLGLKTLEEGIDSIEVRIWCGYAALDSAQLVIIRNLEGRWRAELYSLVFEIVDNQDELTSFSKEPILAKPKSGWQRFSKELFSLGITTLPDVDKVEGYPQHTGRDGFVIEVAKKEKYRIYSYPEPYTRQEKFWQARNMVSIIELLKQEFGFKQLKDPVISSDSVTTELF